MHHPKLYLAALISIGACAPMAESFANTPNWNQPVESKVMKKNDSAVLAAEPAQIKRVAHWERVAGCARDIAAGHNGVVYVTGCDVVPNSRGSSHFYRWNGAAFVPLRVPGYGSAIATFGGTSYTVGGDAMLYSSINDGEWVKRDTPYNQPITDVGAGGAGTWIITSQANGVGGNTIARGLPCPARNDRLLSFGDFCSWQIMPGAAQRVSVGSSAWVVNTEGQIFEWFNKNGGLWERRTGCFTDVAANGIEVYAVSCRKGNGDGNAIFRWNGHNDWIDMQGAGKRVAVDAAGNAWVITDSGEIWRHTYQTAPAKIN